MRRSLQRRVIVGGVVWAVVTTIIGAFALTTIFNQAADRRFNEALQEQHLQLIVALTNAGAPEDIETFLAIPSYQRVYSGRYWQVTDAEGQRFTSPSLFDFELTGNVEGGLWEANGPHGPIRGYSEVITTDDGAIWVASVASSLIDLDAERAEMRRSVALAFGFVALLGVACAALLTAMLVRPLRQLRHDVVHRWDTETALAPEDYPAEVAPLVADINELIARNRNIHDRGRRQAADLAHALKTPSAALRNELVRLSTKVSGTEHLFEALDRIDAQITRSLARMRAATVADVVHVRTDIAASIARLERLFRRTASSDEKDFLVDTASGSVAVDQQDLEEMLGNLLDNAFKWSAGTVRLSAREVDQFVEVLVEDDGPGIGAHLRESVLKEGTRLDTAVPGTGLGLSIVNDLSQAYGGRLDLQESPLGGLLCVLSLPISIVTRNTSQTLSA